MAEDPLEHILKLKENLFPNGVPSHEEVVALVNEDNPSLRSVMLNKIYSDGLPIDEYYLNPNKNTNKDLLKFAQELYNTLGKNKFVKQNAKSVLGLSRFLTSKKIENLDSDYASVKNNIGFSVSDLKAHRTPLLNTIDLGEIKVPKAIQGESLLFQEGKDLPKGALKGVLEGIGQIKDPKLRDVTLLSLLGYRGTDLTGIATNKDIAGQFNPKRPYYDEKGSGFVKTIGGSEGQLGGGKKKKISKQVGPLLQSILDRNFDTAKDGVIFHEYTTTDISNALKDKVFPNIPAEYLDEFDKPVKKMGYTDMRKMLAVMIANDLGQPEVASEILGHTSPNIMTVLNKYYAAVKDVDGFSKRADAMIQVEKLMANAVGEETSLGLATQVNIDPPEKDFVYPQFDATSDGTTATVQGQQTEISPEEQESKKQLRIKTDIRKGVEADVAAAKGVKEKIELYKDISKEDIVKTGEKEALLEQTKTDTKTKLRSIQREEQKKKNKADAIEKNKKASKEAGDFFNDLFGPKVTKMESMMDTSGVKIGPTGEAVIEDKGLNVNIPNLSGLPPAIKAGTALLQGQEADKEVAAGFLSDVVRDTLVETGVAVGTKVLGAGKTLATRLGGAATFLIDPNFPGQGKMGDQTLFGDKFEKLSPEQRQELGLKDSFLTTN